MKHKQIIKLYRAMAWGIALSLIGSPLVAQAIQQQQITVAGTEVEIVPDTDPRYAEIEREFSATFGMPDSAIDASPQLEMGPVIRTDRKGKSIVTFKAAKKECAHYAIAPTEQAVKDKIEIQFVSNDRLPENHKWEYEKEKEYFRFLFKLPITLQYNDSGYSLTHGSGLAKDTNHNWGYRLYKGGSMLTKKEDYEKYVRHMITSNSKYANLASEVDSKEAGLLITWGLADKEYKEKVLDPLRAVADQLAAEAEPGARGVATVLVLIQGGMVFAQLLYIGAVVGAVYGIKGLIALGKLGQAACDARKPSHQTSDLRDIVILAR